jgi:hypothetical protein
MNRAELNRINENFLEHEKRLNSLTLGDSIWEADLADPFGGCYFHHKVERVDLEEMVVHTLDLSQTILVAGGKPSVLRSFYFTEEAFGKDKTKWPKI